MPTEPTRPPDRAEPFAGYGVLRERVEAGLAAAVDSLDPACPDRLRAAMRHSLLAGGKRLRPVLTLLCHRICGGEREDRALPAAVAVELVHTYSLVHDDLPCMDDDDLRRGEPTCHVAFDEATAVLAGDALLTLAFGQLARLTPGAVPDAVAALAAAAGAAGMVGGQARDLEAEANPALIADGAALERIHRGKTAALIACACELGAIAAGAERVVRERMRMYGHCVGMAFQIADDLLDLSADSATLGKTAGKDAAAEKLTYPALYGVRESRRRADAAATFARAAAGAFGDVADPLLALARYAVERDR